jgi:TolA-binding protein
MFEPDEKEIDLEPAAETATDPVAEGETPPAEEVESEIVVSIGNEEPPPEPDASQEAPAWVKELRKQNREQQKRIRELERSMQAPAAKGETNSAPPQKPTLQDVDYDTGAYEAKLDDWYKAKAEYDRKESERQREKDAAKGAWEAKITGYNTAKAELKARDFDDAEAVIADTLSVTQQGIILDGAEKPALLIYALGKNPKKAAELAAITNPVAFAAAIGRLEASLKVTSRKPSAQPEQLVSGNASKSGSVDNQLERLRAEAERTGDLTKVMAYKRQAKRK